MTTNGELLERVRGVLEEKYPDAEFELIGNIVDDEGDHGTKCLYMHLNDDYDNTLSLDEEIHRGRYALIQHRNMRSEEYKTDGDWEIEILPQNFNLQTLVSIFDEAYNRVMQENRNIARENRDAYIRTTGRRPEDDLSPKTLRLLGLYEEGEREPHRIIGTRNNANRNNRNRRQEAEDRRLDEILGTGTREDE